MQNNRWPAPVILPARAGSSVGDKLCALTCAFFLLFLAYLAATFFLGG